MYTWSKLHSTIASSQPCRKAIRAIFAHLILWYEQQRWNKHLHTVHIFYLWCIIYIWVYGVCCLTIFFSIIPRSDFNSKMQNVIYIYSRASRTRIRLYLVYSFNNTGTIVRESMGKIYQKLFYLFLCCLFAISRSSFLQSIGLWISDRSWCLGLFATRRLWLCFVCLNLPAR